MALYTSLTETDNSLGRWFLQTEPLAQSWMATFDRVKRHGYVYTAQDRDAAGLIRGDYHLKCALALGAGAACFFGTAACRSHPFQDSILRIFLRSWLATEVGLTAGLAAVNSNAEYRAELLLNLPTPLGGELAAQLRERDPGHAMLAASSLRRSSPRIAPGGSGSSAERSFAASGVDTGA